MLEHQKRAAAGVETGVELQLERVTVVRFWVFMRALRGTMQSPEEGKLSTDASETSESTFKNVTASDHFERGKRERAGRRDRRAE